MLSQFESQVIANLLEPSAGRLARRLKCPASQARALQHYLVLVFVAAYRRQSGGDHQGAADRAHAILRRLPPRIRQTIVEALGQSGVAA